MELKLWRAHSDKNYKGTNLQLSIYTLEKQVVPRRS